MLEFVRPYTPELVGWFRDFGAGAANYDANGHYARIQPIFNAFQLTDNAGRRPRWCRCPSRSASTGLQTGMLRRCPGAASQPPPDGSAPFRDSGGNLDCDPDARCRPAHDARSSSSSPLLIVARRVAVVVVTAGDDDGGGYQVRAIFDNAGFVIPGEDVKVAGVKVGKIDSLDVTTDFKAAVVLEITEPGYQDFRNDASCIVRPQTLIGERFVECKPTQARAGRHRAAAEAATRSRTGPGKGQYLLPVDQHDADGRHRPDRQHHARARARSGCRSSSTSSAPASPAAGATSTTSSGAPTRRCKEIDKVLAILASPERHAAASWRSTRTRSWRRWRASAARARRDPQLERGRARRRPSGAWRSRPTSRRCRRSSTSSRRRWRSSARSPTR